jgi:hypothetical protein
VVSRLESVISLTAFACIEFVIFRSRWISLAERSRSRFALFVLVLCADFSLSLSPDVAVSGSQWEVQTLSAGISAESVTALEKRFSSLRRGDYSYDVELYAPTKLFAFT